MKLSIVISTHPTDFSALAYKGDFEAGLKNASQLGYDGVELAIRNPADVDYDQLVYLLQEYRLELVALGTGQAYLQEGLSFSHPAESVRCQAVARVKQHIDLASRFGAKVIIGLLRGNVEADMDKSQCLGWMKECFVQCLTYAAKNDTTVVIEPLNRYETNLINTAGEAVELIKELSFPNFQLLLDSFHMNIEEVSIEETIRNYAAYIGHVHVADSNRWAPGFGHLDFSKIIAALEKAGFVGYLSAEIIPQPDPDIAVRQTLTCLKPMIHVL
ncbi:MAG: sugar phosphate isomerase/epimerase [Planctomycetaceae bacterium]|nr:sugar phosphate isomerase/epimerase [Planctomycetaceae bacterium]